MKRRESGFTLIELLTVIAIIAILASILLPVLGKAREQGRRSACTSNLHQIAIAMKIYKQDNRFYPSDRSEAAPKAFWYGTNKTSGDGLGLGALFPEYISTFKAFTCPDSDVSTVDDVNYPSYDGLDPAAGQTRAAGTLKYKRIWKAGTSSTGLNADPNERRQLCWREPPEDTIITWCHLHRNRPEDVTVRTSDKDLIVFLDGRVDTVASALTDHDYGGNGGTP